MHPVNQQQQQQKHKTKTSDISPSIADASHGTNAKTISRDRKMRPRSSSVAFQRLSTLSITQSNGSGAIPPKQMNGLFDDSTLSTPPLRQKRASTHDSVNSIMTSNSHFPNTLLQNDTDDDSLAPANTNSKLQQQQQQQQPKISHSKCFEHGLVIGVPMSVVRDAAVVSASSSSNSAANSSESVVVAPRILSTFPENKPLELEALADFAYPEGATIRRSKILNKQTANANLKSAPPTGAAEISEERINISNVTEAMLVFDTTATDYGNGESDDSSSSSSSDSSSSEDEEESDKKTTKVSKAGRS